MSDEIWARNEIESPCIKICVIHPQERLCVGCYRSIDEIGRWSHYSPAQRQAIMAELPARAPRLSKRRGGRLGRIEGYAVTPHPPDGPACHHAAWALRRPPSLRSKPRSSGDRGRLWRIVPTAR